MSPSLDGLEILRSHAPKEYTEPADPYEDIRADGRERQVELSRLCQHTHPDIVIEGETAFCAICGGDIQNPEAVNE